MADAPYTLVANTSGVFEQKIGTCGSEAEHCPGDRLAKSVTLVSNTVVDGRRTIVGRADCRPIFSRYGGSGGPTTKQVSRYHLPALPTQHSPLAHAD